MRIVDSEGGGLGWWRGREDLSGCYLLEGGVDLGWSKGTDLLDLGDKEGGRLMGLVRRRDLLLELEELWMRMLEEISLGYLGLRSWYWRMLWKRL